MTQPDFDKMTPEQIAEYQVQNCIFCKIIKGEIPARKVFEDADTLCIMDIYPASKGHLLVMPKKHYPFLPAVPADASKNMFRAAKELSKAAKSAIIASSSTIFIANGAIAGQQSPHFIFHIIPREKSDGLDNFNLPAKDVPVSESENFAISLRNRISQILGVKSSEPDETGEKKDSTQIEMKQISVDSDENNTTLEKVTERFTYLANLILENPELRKLIEKDPAGFKKELKKYPDVDKLFDGIDVQKLANALKSMDER